MVVFRCWNLPFLSPRFVITEAFVHDAIRLFCAHFSMLTRGKIYCEGMIDHKDDRYFEFGYDTLVVGEAAKKTCTP